MPSLQLNGSIRGASATFNYKGVTAEAVANIEDSGNSSDKVLLTFDDSGTTKHVLEITNTLQKYITGAIFS